MHCKYCGSENPAGGASCGHCGAPLPPSPEQASAHDSEDVTEIIEIQKPGGAKLKVEVSVHSSGSHTANPRVTLVDAPQAAPIAAPASAIPEATQRNKPTRWGNLCFLMALLSVGLGPLTSVPAIFFGHASIRSLKGTHGKFFWTKIGTAVGLVAGYSITLVWGIVLLAMLKVI